MKLEDVKQAWNAQADEHNQWGDLSGEEMVEFALEMMDKRRCGTCNMYRRGNCDLDIFGIDDGFGCIHWGEKHE